MNQQAPPKEIVTVTEMARMCRLSRARFYQLIGEGIFPTPSRNEQSGRPFFDRQQQEQCLLVRRTNRGANGKTVVFYGCRPQPAPKLPSRRKRLPVPRSSNGRARQDPVITELRHALAVAVAQNSMRGNLSNRLNIQCASPIASHESFAWF